MSDSLPSMKRKCLEMMAGLWEKAFLFSFLLCCVLSDIVPDGDETLKYGDSLQLYCLLNKSHELAANLSSANMKFTSNRNFTGETTVVNDTAIRLFVPEPALGEVFFYCELDGGNGSWKWPVSVAVGSKFTTFVLWLSVRPQVQLSFN